MDSAIQSQSVATAPKGFPVQAMFTARYVMDGSLA
jgi:hypothetical protein